MNVLDFALLILIFFYAWSGLWMGVVQKVGGLVALVLGASLATRYYDMTGAWVRLLFFENDNLAKVAGFVIILFFVYIFITFILMKIVPAGLPYNHLLGFFLGAAEGILAAGVVLFFVVRFPFWPELNNALTASSLSPVISKATYLIWPFIPDVIKNLKV